MSTAEVIAICVALISVAGGIWIQVIQLKKDSDTMDSIKSDISEMKLTLHNVDEDVKKLRDKLAETIVSERQKIETLVLNESQVKGDIANSFKPNEAWLQVLDKTNEKNTKLEIQIENLKYDNEMLKKQLRIYKGEKDKDRSIDL